MSGNDIKIVDIALLNLVKSLIEKRHQFVYLKWAGYYYQDKIAIGNSYIWFDTVLREFKNYQILGFLKLKTTRLYKFLKDNNWALCRDTKGKNSDIYNSNHNFLDSRIFCFQPGDQDKLC